jgi:two-component system, NtrC family, sensor kinase
MKPLGEAANELPWLSPCVASLTTLAGAPLSAVWPQLRADPGVVLLTARALGSDAAATTLFPADVGLLEQALAHLQAGDSGFSDWSRQGPDQVYRACLRQAQLAAALAVKAGCSVDQAWAGGMLAPLGWLAACAADPVRSRKELESVSRRFDPAPVARRLARRWRVPLWLAPMLGQLGLEADVAVRLGAERGLFQVVQLAVLLYQQRDPGLGLVVGASSAELLVALKLTPDDIEAIVWQVYAAEIPARSWEPPSSQPLMPALLRLALDNRRLAVNSIEERLHGDLDRMQEALEQQGADEKDRLHGLKLAALAEFAAGAGHEINNPLAVISGQAQYILRQLDLLDGPADEIDDVGAYLNHLRGSVVPSLKKIIGQTQRVHGILTGLMQFARPALPRLQPVELLALIREVVDSLRDLARERQVRLGYPEAHVSPVVDADAAQLRLALTCLLRNAIEAAPAEGWAQVRVDKGSKGALQVFIEDNGAGPPPSVREHLFDPFFSGRSAGRGRGLGLATAWRLAREHGGDVYFDEQAQGVTRFVLTLPAPAAAAIYPERSSHSATAPAA